MEHRHIATSDWTLDAIDSALERGDLPDWRELFAAAKVDQQVDQDILTIAEKRDLGGASVLAHEWTSLLWPELAGRKLTTQENREASFAMIHIEPGKSP
jgi:hypothetical protein